MAENVLFAPGGTESVCPVCLKRIGAARTADSQEVSLVKECPDHGTFRTVIWRGDPEMNQWKRPKLPVHPEVCYAPVLRGCPFDCGLCEEHRQLPCSVLVEITDRCNLRCPVCFAGSGPHKEADPDFDTVAFWFRRAMDAAGPCNVQLSGGEPTMRDDLPQIIGIARATGFSFIQLNTNGIRLASERNYAQTLKEAGLASVFLQFDGVDDEVYRSLRGRPLLKEKLLAIERCGDAGLGVILVPTVVRNVNLHSLGPLVKRAVQLAPAVRGVHIQPMSYFGRYPSEPRNSDRITLPEVMQALEEQTEGMVKAASLSPPGTEHSLCSFHATFVIGAGGSLRPITQGRGSSCCFQSPSAGVRQTVSLVSLRWSAPDSGKRNGTGEPGNRRTGDEEAHPNRAGGLCIDSTVSGSGDTDSPMDLDDFLHRVRNDSFTISCMAFQDAWNLDLERLKGCCISVVNPPDGRLIPFCAYNLSGVDGRRLYRGTTEAEGLRPVMPNTSF